MYGSKVNGIEYHIDIAEEDHVDILVNNAGIMLYPKFKLTDDGHELVWQTNYLG